MPDDKPAISAAIIVDRQWVLMVKRRVTEGALSWQFPAGGIEPGETPGQAAVRETKEETTLTVTEDKHLGERIHPKTGREMHYTACAVVEGVAAVGDMEELAGVAWISLAELPEYVPYGLFEPVQEYLDSMLVAA
ncbi:NUDIX hydrolase [Saccharopolyspora tripterygii]